MCGSAVCAQGVRVIGERGVLKRAWISQRSANSHAAMQCVAASAEGVHLYMHASAQAWQSWLLLSGARRQLAPDRIDCSIEIREIIFLGSTLRRC